MNIKLHNKFTVALVVATVAVALVIPTAILTGNDDLFYTGVVLIGTVVTLFTILMTVDVTYKRED